MFSCGHADGHPISPSSTTRIGNSPPSSGEGHHALHQLRAGRLHLVSLPTTAISRTITLVLLSLAGTLVVTGCSSGTSMVTLSFQTKSVTREVIDTGPKGSSHGDLVAGHGELLDADGEVIGQFDVVTTVNRILDGADGRFVEAEYSFGAEGADSFLITGAEQFATDGGLPVVKRPATYAVIGGTGIYKGANGQCDVFRNEDPKAFTSTVTCSFAVLE